MLQTLKIQTQVLVPNCYTKYWFYKYGLGLHLSTYFSNLLGRRKKRTFFTNRSKLIISKKLTSPGQGFMVQDLRVISESLEALWPHGGILTGALVVGIDYVCLQVTFPWSPEWHWPQNRTGIITSESNGRSLLSGHFSFCICLRKSCHFCLPHTTGHTLLWTCNRSSGNHLLTPARTNKVPSSLPK